MGIPFLFGGSEAVLQFPKVIEFMAKIRYTKSTFGGVIWQG